jgi:hypothetical protein
MEDLTDRNNSGDVDVGSAGGARDVCRVKFNMAHNPKLLYVMGVKSGPASRKAPRSKRLKKPNPRITSPDWRK